MTVTPVTIWHEARDAARKAAHEANGKLGPEASRGFDCGFAWVVITPCRGPVVSYLKAQGVGARGYGGGLHIWYSKLHDLGTQSISVHEAAARAACEVFKRHGLQATWASRLD